jgi:uncharacterized membrane protein
LRRRHHVHHRLKASAAPILNDELFQWLVAIVMALLLLYTIGHRLARGRQEGAGAVEGLIARIPVVETVYSCVQETRQRLATKSDVAARGADRISIRAEAIGLVMRRFRCGHRRAGCRLRADNAQPASGYLEIVPLRALVPTTTMDQAMTMIVSGRRWRLKSQHRARAAARCHVKSSATAGELTAISRFHAPQAQASRMTCRCLGVNSARSAGFERGESPMIRGA